MNKACCQPSVPQQTYSSSTLYWHVFHRQYTSFYHVGKQKRIFDTQWHFHVVCKTNFWVWIKMSEICLETLENELEMSEILFKHLKLSWKCLASIWAIINWVGTIWNVLGKGVVLCTRTFWRIYSEDYTGVTPYGTKRVAFCSFDENQASSGSSSTITVTHYEKWRFDWRLIVNESALTKLVSPSLEKSSPTQLKVIFSYPTATTKYFMAVCNNCLSIVCAVLCQIPASLVDSCVSDPRYDYTAWAKT